MGIGAAIIGAAVSSFGLGGLVAGSTIFGLGAFGSFLVRAAIGIALNALTPKPRTQGANRGYQVTTRGSALDHQIIYGRMRVGGAIVYDKTTGTNNKFLHRVIAFAGHEVESFDEVYIDDEVLTLDTNGEVTAPSKYAGKIRVNEHLGSPDQQADSDLVSEDPEWTAQHRLRGIAYLYIRLQFDQNAFPNGVPDITATIKGKKVYDPRTDITAWSDNPCLCLRDYLSSGYGLSEKDVNIDDDLVSAGANVCDETNTISGEKRFTCNGAFVTQVTPIDILNDLLTSMGGLLWYAQGQWRMKPAYYVAPTLTFTEDDLRSNISVRTRHSRRDNFNTVKGTFRGEESNWQVTDYPEVSNSAFVAADNGQESVLDLELPFTDNADEARRIARIVLERNRQQLTVSASFGLRAFQVQTGDIINLSVERFGWTEKEFEVTSWTFGLTDAQDLQVQMTLREISESVFDEIDDGIVYERDNTTLPSPFITVAPQNLTVSDGGFTTDDGTFVNSFIVDWDAPDDAFVDYYELEWRVQGDSVFKGTSLRTTEYQIAPVVSSQTYEIRVKAINTFGVSGPYASVTSSVGGDTTAPSIPTEISATGGFKYITIDWTNPTDADLNYIEVWENTTNTSVGATLIGEVWGNQFVRTKLGINETRFYFLRSVDFSGNTSGFSSGVSATTTFIDDADFENGIRTLFEEQGLYPIEDVENLPASGVLNRKVFNRADGKLYEWNGTDWILVVSAAETDDLIGQITETQITDNAISTPKLQAGAVTATEIAGSTITGDKIVANTITGGLLSTSGIITNSAQINNGLITNAKIQNATIETAKIGNNQVTFTVGAYETSTINSGGLTTPADSIIITASIDCTGAPVNVASSFFLQPFGDIDALKFTDHTWSSQLIRIKDGVSTVIFTGFLGTVRVRNTNTYGWGLGSCSFNRRDDPGAGTITYQLRVFTASGSNGLTIFHRSMLLSELKK